MSHQANKLPVEGRTTKRTTIKRQRIDKETHLATCSIPIICVYVLCDSLYCPNNPKLHLIDSCRPRSQWLIDKSALAFVLTEWAPEWKIQWTHIIVLPEARSQWMACGSWALFPIRTLSFIHRICIIVTHYPCPGNSGDWIILWIFNCGVNISIWHAIINRLKPKIKEPNSKYNRIAFAGGWTNTTAEQSELYQ